MSDILINSFMVTPSLPSVYGSGSYLLDTTTISSYADHWVYVFTGNGSLTVVGDTVTATNVTVVGGGGGGAGGTNGMESVWGYFYVYSGGGGGGGGGVQTWSNVPLQVESHICTVGAGGSSSTWPNSATMGDSSSFAVYGYGTFYADPGYEASSPSANRWESGVGGYSGNAYAPGAKRFAGQWGSAQGYPNTLYIGGSGGGGATQNGEDSQTTWGNYNGGAGAPGNGVAKYLDSVGAVILGKGGWGGGSNSKYVSSVGVGYGIGGSGGGGVSGGQENGVAGCIMVTIPKSSVSSAT